MANFGLAGVLSGLAQPLEKEAQQEREMQQWQARTNYENMLLSNRERANREFYSQERQSARQEQNQSALQRLLFENQVKTQAYEQQRSEAQNYYGKNIVPLAMSLPHGKQLHPLSSSQKSSLMDAITKTSQASMSNPMLQKAAAPVMKGWQQALEPSADEVYSQKVASGQAKLHDTDGNVSPSVKKAVDSYIKNITENLQYVNNDEPLLAKPSSMSDPNSPDTLTTAQVGGFTFAKPDTATGGVEKLTKGDVARARIQFEKANVFNTVSPDISQASWDWLNKQAREGATLGDIMKRFEEAGPEFAAMSKKGSVQLWLMQTYLQALTANKADNPDEPLSQVLDAGSKGQSTNSKARNADNGDAPQDAIDYLKSHNTASIRKQFKAKYGYLPQL